MPQIHVAAIHADPGYRVFTPGIGVLCREESLSGGMGFYANSNGGKSAYGMAAWQPIKVMGARLGAFAGMVNGYRRGGGNFVPMAGIAATYGNVNLIAWPKADAQSSAGIGLSFTVPI